MYREDTSTSSEDETSTAAAAASTTTTTTADMCRVEVRNGKKVLGCTGCGYTSDRRGNVTRHYERIHGKLKKYRQCPCGDTFPTKWTFYKHCRTCPRSQRQSSYTTTYVYKLEQPKSRSQLRSVTRPKRKIGSSRGLARESLVTRASTQRLRIQEEPSTTSNESSAASLSSGSETFPEEEPLTVSNESSAASFSSACETFPEKYEEPLTTSNESSLASLSSRSETSPAKYEDGNDENAAASLTYLPPKKRYLKERKIFGDITNTYKVQKVNDCNDKNNNKTQVSTNQDCSTIDEKQRAYISHIDFEELDAILMLRDMKKAM